MLAFVLSVAAGVAEPMRCEDARAAKSFGGGPMVDLLVKNDRDDPLTLVWIDFEGREVPSGSIPGRATHWERSYLDHVFTLKSATGTCVCATRMSGRTRWTRGADACREANMSAGFEPTSTYDVEVIEGWRVLVSSKFKDHGAERAAALAALRTDLAKIRRQLLPRSAVRLLRKTKIWLEWTDDLLPDRAAYHPYRPYMVAMGLNPDKAQSVQFTVRSLEQRVRQPAMVLHELAHAFHDQVLGFDDPTILAGYFRACADTRLHSVERKPGEPQRHYGLNDQTEFFAEFTEAAFWENDFPPKERAALTAFDPSILRLIEQAWKKPRAAKVNLGAPQQVCPKG